MTSGARNHTVKVTKGVVPVHEKDRPENKNNNSLAAIEIHGTSLEFQVQARVKVLEATVGSSSPLTNDSSASLFARPMQLKSTITASHLKVSLKRVGAPSEISLQCRYIDTKKAAPTLWGHYAEEPPSKVVSEPLMEHAMAFDVAVIPLPAPKKNLLAVDVFKFNAVDLGENGQGGKIPAMKTARDAGKSVKVGTFGTRRDTYICYKPSL